LISLNPARYQFFTINSENFTMATKPGLYANIHAKEACIKAGSGEKMRKPTRKAASLKRWKCGS